MIINSKIIHIIEGTRAKESTMAPLGLDVQGPIPRQLDRMPFPAPTGAKLTAAIRAALLDPKFWRVRLGEFARATGLAVALTDSQGCLLGGYIHAQSDGNRSPSLQSAAVAGCPFSPTLPPCSRVRDALLVALTGYGQEGDKRRSEEAGFNAHLVKPVALDTLRELLSRAASLAPQLT
jgi:hypothetical protein